ncbi:mannitol dehydrogenase family protein [Sinosporangium siamense]|uniref:Mannitol dehydrogenase n=1 Tax=Sinosporangium siamense TaxID=1367973 RepID=A0A919RN61_9ACTN|nr:mannitol dehydrogenase family protein [Sinosporangium siamense]GII95534.1 mannitol dehydrogenase [Sinosporangium siamense]
MKRRPRLTRATAATTEPRLTAPRPVRIVHLGLGAFHRAHQAWYTDVVDEAKEWGIAAFTGQSPDRAVELMAQDGLYSVIERAADGDRARVVGSISAAHDGAAAARFAGYLADPGVAIVTSTITEAGYRISPDGQPIAAPEVDADLDALRRWRADTEPPTVVTAPGRLLLGLQARRRAEGGPIAVVPCDNVPDNGRMVRSGLLQLADRIDPLLAAWIDREAAFVSTVVDRITPATTPADVVAGSRLTGFDDRSPVVTEPFHDWVLAGEFPNGRPAWELAGATFVSDTEPFERRKLGMLNGAHTILAATGLVRGHTTVAEAIADPKPRELVERFWDEAARSLPAEVDPDGYRAQLIQRFANARIRHRLEQIAADSTLKVRLRILPILEAELAAGRPADTSIAAVAAWLRLAERRPDLPDPAAAALREAPPGTHGDRVRLAAVDERLVEDHALSAQIIAAASAATDL